MLKYIYITVGTITLIIGLIGIVTPMVPVTPFILLTGILYARSSPRLHKKLLNNKITGRYIKRMSEGITLKTCLCSIAFMWCMVCISAFIFLDPGKARFILLGLGLIGTCAQIIVYRKKRVKTIEVKQ